MNENKSLYSIFFTSGVVQILGRACSAFLGIFIARNLGPVEFGHYSYIYSCITISSVFAISGMPNLLVREMSQTKIYHEVKELLLFSFVFITLISMLSSIIMYIYLFEEFKYSFNLFVIFLFFVLFRSYLINMSAVFNGIKYPILSQFFLVTIFPLFSIFFIYALIISERVIFDSWYFISVQVFVLILVNIISFFVLYSKIKKTNLVSEYSQKSKKGQLFKSLIPLSFLGLLSSANNEFSIILLKEFSSSAEVGIYRVGFQLMLLLSLPSLIVNTILSPKIFSLFSKDKIEECQDMITNGVRTSAVCFFPILLFIIIFSEKMIVFIYGEEFKLAANVLEVLAIGQLFNVLLGPVGMVMNMTKNERFSVLYLTVSVVIMIALLVLLVPMYGALGAAIAVSFSLIFYNSCLCSKLYNLTGIKSWIR